MVIAMAWKLQQEHCDRDERRIVLRAFRDVSVSKIFLDDLKLLIFSGMQISFI
jgi:hypothetical protein